MHEAPLDLAAKASSNSVMYGGFSRENTHEAPHDIAASQVYMSAVAYGGGSRETMR